MTSLSSLTLDSLIRRLLPAFNPDPHDRARAWNEWIARGGSDPVLKFIRWSNGTTADDEEILQETLIIAYVKVEQGRYEPRDVPFTAFLKQIARFKILEAARNRKRKVSLDELNEELVVDEPLDVEQAEYWKEHEALQAALKCLPPRRSSIVMLYEHGYSTAEIAERLGIREDLVRKEKSLGMQQLRKTVMPTFSRTA